MRDLPRADPAVRAYAARYAADVCDVRRVALADIAADPDRHAGLFAALEAHCCCCGRALEDPYSVALGIGPECRRGLSPGRLARLADLTAQARAEHSPALRVAA